MWKYILAAILVTVAWGLCLYLGVHWAVPLGSLSIRVV